MDHTYKLDESLKKNHIQISLAKDIIKHAREEKDRMREEYKNGQLGQKVSDEINKASNPPHYFIPTSHFHINPNISKILHYLESSFIIWKYSKLKDKDGNDMIIYAINYGACVEESIDFGRLFSKYWQQRNFDYTDFILKQLGSKREIKCSKCQNNFTEDNFQKIIELKNELNQTFILCPKCGEKDSIETQNIIPKSEVEEIEKAKELKLKPYYIEVLQTLNNIKTENGLIAKKIGAITDHSSQAASGALRFLENREFVYKISDKNPYQYLLTKFGQSYIKSFLY